MEAKAEKTPEFQVGQRFGVGRGFFHVTGFDDKLVCVVGKSHSDSKREYSINVPHSWLREFQRIETLEKRSEANRKLAGYWKDKWVVSDQENAHKMKNLIGANVRQVEKNALLLDQLTDFEKRIESASSELAGYKISATIGWVLSAVMAAGIALKYFL